MPPTVDPVPLSSLLAGLGLGLSLIVAIGAQNLFVLRQGIRREHVFAVAAICALSDLALIIVGVSGIGAVLQAVPWLVDVIRWAGAAFLVVYGLLAARRAIRPSGEALVAEDARVDPAVDAGDGCRERRGSGRPPARGIRHRLGGTAHRDRTRDGAAHHDARSRGAHLPRAHLAEPARVPRHGVPARLGREHARRRPVGVRRGRRRGEHRCGSSASPTARDCSAACSRARAPGACSTASSRSS